MFIAYLTIPQLSLCKLSAVVVLSRYIVGFSGKLFQESKEINKTLSRTGKGKFLLSNKTFIEWSFYFLDSLSIRFDPVFQIFKPACKNMINCTLFFFFKQFSENYRLILFLFQLLSSLVVFFIKIVRVVYPT